MKKTDVLWIIIDTIGLIVFNALFFVIGGGTSQVFSVWLSYAFIHFAYAMLIVTPVLVRGGKSGTIFGFSIHSISTGYFLLQLATGTVLIIIAMESYGIPLLIQLCLAGLYGILLLVSMITGERTAKYGGKRKPEALNIKETAIRLKAVQEKVNDKAAKKKVEKVYDTLRSSPAKPYPELAQIDNYIVQSISGLEQAAYAGDKGSVITISDSLMDALNDRKKRLKELK